PADRREQSRRAESTQTVIMPKGPSTPPPPPVTGAVLHLASFRTEEAAMRGWEQALAKNQALLANLRPVIRKADLGPQQGLFYRLMIGPFASLTDAEATCIELKKSDQFCRATTIDG
ncbi:MAG: SPOR domain-containing protein, partial [Rhodobacteraceae bacterium]|nr:SPOR domain-containing protein [Paracoccaceae bacterium]